MRDLFAITWSCLRNCWGGLTNLLYAIPYLIQIEWPSVDKPYDAESGCDGTGHVCLHSCFVRGQRCLRTRVLYKINNQSQSVQSCNDATELSDTLKKSKLQVFLPRIRDLNRECKLEIVALKYLLFWTNFVPYHFDCGLLFGLVWFFFFWV